MKFWVAKFVNLLTYRDYSRPQRYRISTEAKNDDFIMNVLEK